MPSRSSAARFLCLVAMASWAGGFAFYGAAVVPVLHDELDRLQAGAITARVTVALNVLGGATLAAWWAVALSGRSGDEGRARWGRFGLLAASSALLFLLVALHRVMDGRLDAGTLRGFYPLHRAYLIASTVQWFVNLGLLALMPSTRGGKP